VRLSFYTYSYTDRLKMSIPDCFKQIASAGYSGVDISGTNGSSANPKSIDSERRKLTRQAAKQHGLKVEAVITHAQLTDTLADPKVKPLDLRGSIDLAADVGANVVTFHMGGYHDGIPQKVMWQQVVSVLKAACDYAEPKHVSVAVDGIWPVWINDSPDAMQRMFDDVDCENFGVNFDPCYLTLMKVNPVKYFQRFRGRVVHAHLKDHVGDYPKWTHKIPGQGTMNYTPIFAEMQRLKFSGSSAVECFTDMPFDEARDSGYKAMVAAANKAGVKFK